MKIKVSELSDEKLDFWVAKANEDLPSWFTHEQIMSVAKFKRYSSDWSQGGPIIEREHITPASLYAKEGALGNHPAEWHAFMYEGVTARHKQSGPTPLIAAMRCFISSRFGEFVDEK